jgi:hypothetical protein
MMVELSTIPLYLFGMYSVKDAPGVVNAVRGVVLEEMLHLSLAGNTLLAVGGTPKLYDPKIISAYPTPMPGRTPELILHLRKMTNENLQTYIDLELPESGPDAPAEPDEYETLGQFYKAIEQGLEFLAKDPSLFKPATISSQFGPGPDAVFTPTVADAGGLVLVTDLSSALLALKTIVNQGEGNPRPYVDPSKGEKDHYDIFLELRKGTPWVVFPVVTDPTTQKYFDLDQKIYAVSRTVDASFCYLLLTLEKLWTVSSPDDRQKLIQNNMTLLMISVIAPLATFLISQPIGNAGEVAAPCFGYYPFGSRSSALADLQKEIQTAIDAYAGNASAVTQLKEIQETMGGLVNIG